MYACFYVYMSVACFSVETSGPVLNKIFKTYKLGQNTCTRNSFTNDLLFLIMLLKRGPKYPLQYVHHGTPFPIACFSLFFYIYRM